MPKAHPSNKAVLEERFRRTLLGYTEQILHTRLDLFTLQTCLIDKGLISDEDLRRSVEKATQQGKTALADLSEASPDRMLQVLRGKRDDVQ